MFICRVCLTLDDNLYPISPTYLKPFVECTGIFEIKTSDFLCPSCIRKLTEAHGFRSEALKSDEILKNDLQELINAEIKREPVDDDVISKPDEDGTREVFVETEEFHEAIEVLEEETLDEEYEYPYEGPTGVLEVTIKPKINYIPEEALIETEVDVAKSVRSIKAKMAWTEETKKFLIKNCPYCFYYSKNKIEMRDHIQEHLTINGGVECDHCRKKWPSKLRLYEHLHKVFKGGYKRQKKFSNGVITTEDGTIIRRRMFNCDYCDFQSEERIPLEKHVQLLHPNAEAEHNFLCNTCGRTFPSQKKLRNHLQTHKEPKNNKKFECKYCGKRFKLKASQQYHLLSHTNELNFTCPTCGKGFKTKQALRDHEPVHTGELPFQCDGCDKRFRSRGLLRSHRLVHFEGKYQCDICLLKFRRTSNLNDHLLCHTERRDYSCSTCGTLFKAAASLKRHMKKHNDKLEQENRVIRAPIITGEVIPHPNISLL